MSAELFGSVSDKFLKSAQAEDAFEKAALAPTVEEVLLATCKGDSVSSRVLMERIMSSTKFRKDTAMTAKDFANFRMPTPDGSLPLRYNKDTKFLNLCEANGTPKRAFDLQHTVDDQDIVTESVDPINLEASSLPAIKNGRMNRRTNTITAFGQQISDSILGRAIASQQLNFDSHGNQIMLANLRIRKGESKTLLSSVEVVKEADGFVPAMGGYIQRSDSTGHTLPVSGDFTDSDLLDGYKLIRAKFGSGLNMVLWTSVAQVEVIDNLMINRFGGENSAAYAQTVAMYKAMFGDMVKVEAVYKVRTGEVIAVVSDDQLPSGYSILFTLENGLYPLLSKFWLFGAGPGPYPLVRPEETLFDDGVVIDLIGLHDPLPDSRVVYTGVN